MGCTSRHEHASNKGQQATQPTRAHAATLKVSAAPLLQYRLPLGLGPSLKTWPWWHSQRTQWYSVRGRIILKSILVPNAPCSGV